MPKTIQELIAWLEANPEQRISKLPDEMYTCIDNWRVAISAHTSSAVEMADPKLLLAYIKAAKELLGEESLAEIERTFNEY